MKTQNQSRRFLSNAAVRGAACLLLFVLATGRIIAQDKITLLNGEELNGRITEITDSEIKYISSENPAGPTRVVYKTEIFLIKYENGTRELVSQAPSQPAAPVSTSAVSKKEKDSVFVSKRKKFGGPRIGLTYLSPGTTADYLADEGKQPVITQFGWQFETRLFSVENGPSGIVEFIPMIGGMEQGMFLPSANLLIGLRGSGNQSIEAAIGPNVSITGVGMIFAIGCNFQTGNINFPFNIAYVPSVGHKEDGEIVQTGSR